jgi:hypothetical protein
MIKKESHDEKFPDIVFNYGGSHRIGLHTGNSK